MPNSKLRYAVCVCPYDRKIAVGKKHGNKFMSWKQIRKM